MKNACDCRRFYLRGVLSDKAKLALINSQIGQNGYTQCYRYKVTLLILGHRQFLLVLRC